MCDSSDSENEDMKNFLESIDTNLLRDDFFKANSNDQNHEMSITPTKTGNVYLKSQRYLSDSEVIDGTDLKMSKDVQRHIAKKLTDLINNQVEFYKCTNTESLTKDTKSRVKLLTEFDCYVKSYEEFEYDTKGLDKKPQMKRRRLAEELLLSEVEKINAAVVSPTDILNGTEVQAWAVKKDRSDRVFHYVLANNNILHAKEPITEFTQARRKNKWNASKIKVSA